MLQEDDDCCVNKYRSYSAKDSFFIYSGRNLDRHQWSHNNVPKTSTTQITCHLRNQQDLHCHDDIARTVYDA